MEPIKIDRFHTYEELTALLQGWAAAHPGLTRLFSAGESPEGRQQWVLELTNGETGAAADKPAYFINGNTHAGEVSGSAACIYTIQYLLLGYGHDNLCTHVLDTRTIYVMPRITMDGSEYYLTTPNSVRSAPRPYPQAEPADGLTPQDIDGNGLILQMRFPDPLGEWKISEQDPRLMVKRAPDEFGGEYYRVYPEGLIHNSDGVEIKLAKPAFGLDFNRNFAANWAPEHLQTGSGPYPFSEPETKAVADFMLAHKNIVGTLAYHTTAGLFLRPFANLSDEKMPPADLEVYKTLEQMGEETADLPTFSLHQQFWDPNRLTVGSFPEGDYEALGGFGLEIELWNIYRRAGCARAGGFKGLRERTYAEQVGDDLKLLAWNDQELDGAGFINWYPFEHPQLGQVELGGWNTKYVRQNVPGHLLEAEIRGSALFTIQHAAASPLLQIEKLVAERLADTTYRLHLVAVNTGYLATNVTEMALRLKAAKPVEARLELDGLTLLTGDMKADLGHIRGFGKGQANWVLQGSGTVRVTVWGEKAGVVTQTINL